MEYRVSQNAIPFPEKVSEIAGLIRSNNHRHCHFFLAITLAFAVIQTCFAQEKNPQTLEEINAELQAKKLELEPFDERKVKVDLESLGLDDVDKKTEKNGEIKSEQAGATPAVSGPQAGNKNQEASQDIKQNTKNESVSRAAIAKTTAVEGALLKIKNVLHLNPKEQQNKSLNALPAEPEKLPITSAADTKKTTTQYINSKKKRRLKKRLENEKKKKWNEKHHNENLKKLQELREKYLEPIEEAPAQNPGPGDENYDGSNIEFSEKIVPQKKNLNKFLSEEMPALPILNRYRTHDNAHIPIVLTPKERINVLFSAISTGSISYFNDAYRDIQNPNVKNDFGDTILTRAILSRKYPIVASVLAKGADPNMPNKLGYTPVNIAIEMLDIKSLELLASNNADLNYTDAFGRTYLMHAARLGFLPAVDLLVSRGVDVNSMDNDNFTALSIAYRNRKEIIVQYLLKHGAKTWIEKPYIPEKQSLIKELENRWK